MSSSVLAERRVASSCGSGKASEQSLIHQCQGGMRKMHGHSDDRQGLERCPRLVSNHHRGLSDQLDADRGNSVASYWARRPDSANYGNWFPYRARLQPARTLVLLLHAPHQGRPGSPRIGPHVIVTRDWTHLIEYCAGSGLTRAAHNGVASRLGTAKVSSRTNLSRNLRLPASTTIRSR